MKHPRRSAFVAGIATIALLMPAVPAFADADPSDPVDEVAASVAEVAPSDLVSAELTEVPDGVVASLEGGGETTLATDPVDGIEVSSADGDSSLSFTLPAASRLDDGVVADDGSVTYVGDAKTPSVNVVAADDALRVTTVIEGSGQPQRFPYDFGTGATVEIQDDGGAIVYVIDFVTDPETGQVHEAEKIVADIASPWAKDSAGLDVPTHYEASGSVLTQVVSHVDGGYAYPVIADPTFDRPNIFQYRVRFNRAETATIAVGGWGGVIGSWNCGVMAPVCALASGAIAYQAGVAQNSKPKRCVQVTATQPYVVLGLYWWVDTYSGGSCR